MFLLCVYASLQEFDNIKTVLEHTTAKILIRRNIHVLLQQVSPCVEGLFCFCSISRIYERRVLFFNVL